MAAAAGHAPADEMRRGARQFIVFVTLGATVVGCTGGAAPAASGPAPSQVQVDAVSPTSLEVRWEADQDAHRWLVLLAAPDGRSVGQRTVCGACREVTVEHLAPSSAYAIRVVSMGEDRSFGPFGDPTEAETPGAPGCDDVDAAETCAVVDGTPGGAATGVGLGALHGITSQTSIGAVTPLRPRAWRVSALDFERFALARFYETSVTALLSDAWLGAAGTAAPWDDWVRYEAFVGQVVEAHVAAQAVPDYWEVQNEPGAEGSPGGGGTAALVLEQHERAAAVIHALLPDARVIGPSASYVVFGGGIADMETYAGLATTGDLAGLSWHEIGAGCLGDCDGGPRAVLQHADDVRAAVAGAAGAVEPELHVNEWGAPWNFSQPGAVLGYLSSLATAGIDVANPACWSTAGADGSLESSCFVRPGTLGGLLLPDGRTPTDAWFAHAAYAEMTQAGSRILASTIGDPEASVFATVDAAGLIRAVLGRHTGCAGGIDENCPAGVEYAPEADLSLVLAPPAGSTVGYAARVERIRSVAGASSGRELVATMVLPGGGDPIPVGTWTVADGDALLVTLLPLP
ncbi:MAG: fibronectin type III domain-containing protein [Acidimicrobiia bacterium]|nr:fibronectin type III domain-containing protein [Acidimicrobiia bacterium]